MNSLIEYVYKTKRVQDAEGNLINPFPGSISYDQGVALYNIIRTTKVENTLEIGMAYGLSTLFICQAHHDNGVGRHTAIDPYECTMWKSIGLLNIRKTGLEHILRFYEGPSHQILPSLLQDDECFDFIFIDGVHLFDYTLIEFFYADKLLNPGGYIMFHDLWMPSIRKVLGFVLRNREYKLAPEFSEGTVSLRKRCLGFLRDLVHSPFNINSSESSIKREYPHCVLKNYCVLKKISNDDRKWEHYNFF